MIALASTFGMNFNVVLPAVASLLNLNSVGFGLLTASMGVGALIAALVVAAGQRPRIRLLIGGALLMGAAEVALSQTTYFTAALAFVFLAGVGAVSMAATANAMIQVTVPGPLRGRVMAVYTTVFVGSSPVGNSVTGVTGSTYGTPVAVFMDGFMAILAGLAALAAVLRFHVRVGGGKRTPVEVASVAAGPGIPTVD